MDYSEKSRLELMEELEALERRVTELEGVQSKLEMTKQALNESQLFLDQLSGHLRQFLFIRSRDNVLHIGPAYEKIFGRPAEELRRNANTFLQYVHREDRERIREAMARSTFEEGKSFNEEYRIILPDGSERWVWSRSFPVKDAEGVVYRQVGLAEDITDLKQAQEELRRSKETLEALLNATTDVAALIDKQGTILAANQETAQRLGSSCENLVGSCALDRFTPEIARWLKEGLRRIVSTGAPLRKEQARIGRRIFDASAYPVFDQNGQVEGVAVFALEITEQKELEAQLLQASKMEAVGTLAGGIAHDFNNLLQVILGYSELLLKDKDSNEHDYGRVSGIKEAARKGKDLIDRILTFSRRVEFNPVPLDLNEQIKQSVELLKRTFPKTIEIELQLAQNLKIVSAARAQVEQILLNLAVNAKDSMPEGGKLTLATRNMTLDASYCTNNPQAKPGEYVLLCVSDTGIGMEKEVLEHIFEPFYTTKTMGKGTGLGLATVYGIVKGHEGYISCRSEPNEGTTFEIFFPVTRQDSQLDPAMTGEMPPFGTETILLVDDDEVVREVGSEMISLAGYKVLTAASGREALVLYEKAMAEIDLVILDLIMPKMGGMECLGKILEMNPEAKVLVASGFHEDASTKHVLESGAKGFIGKPFDTKSILLSIRKIVDER